MQTSKAFVAFSVIKTELYLSHKEESSGKATLFVSTPVNIYLSNQYRTSSTRDALLGYSRAWLESIFQREIK